MTREARLERAQEIVASFPQRSSAVIPLLHLWQDSEGYLSDDSIAEVADVMGMPAAEVQEVVSFYSMFRRKPLGRYRIEVCKSISCALCGAGTVLEHLQQRLGVGLNEATPDGMFSVNAVECLARCDLAPVGQVNLEYTGRLTPEAVDAIIDRLRAGQSVSAAIGGETGA